MVQFPAFCPRCGLVFASRMFSLSHVQGLTMSGNRESCPRCGAMAELPDGTFNVTGDTIEVLAASGLTRARLLLLADVLRSAQSQGASSEAVGEAVLAEAPALRSLVERYAPRMRQAFVVFLLMVIELLLAQGIAELRDDSATREDVRKAIEQALEQVQHEDVDVSRAPQATPKPSAPRPAAQPPTPKGARRSKGTKPDGAKRAKRPAKQYGARKKRKRR